MPRFDGVVEVDAPKLIEKLEQAGCRRLGTRNGRALFHNTETVRQLIRSYTFRPKSREKEIPMNKCASASDADRS
jgi:hypothetical protein